jgi:hypothetical protein
LLLSARILKQSPGCLTLAFDAAADVKDDETSGVPDVSGWTLEGLKNARMAAELVSGGDCAIQPGPGGQQAGVAGGYWLKQKRLP